MDTEYIARYQLASHGLGVADELPDGEVYSYSYHPHRPSVPVMLYVAAIVWMAIIALIVLVSPHVTLWSASNGSLSCRICVTEDARMTMYGVKGYATIIDGPYKGEKISFLGNTDFDDDFIPRAHERFYVSASWVNVKDEQRDDLIRHGCRGVIRIADMQPAPNKTLVGLLCLARQKMIDSVKHYAIQPSMGRALVLALLFGDKSELSAHGFYDAIKTLGLAHLVAVSGAHLSIVSAVLALILQKTPLPKRATIVLLSVSMLMYVVLTGCGPSVIRAAIVSILCLASGFFNRRSCALSSLACCVVIMLVIQPTNAFSLSFSLSVLSTAGIVVFTPLFSSWLTCVTGQSCKTLRDVVAMTCAANIATLPISCTLFGRFPVMCVVTNAVASAFLGVFLPVALVLVMCGLCVPVFSGVLVRIPVYIAHGFAQVCMAASGTPFVSLPVVVHPMVITMVCVVVIVGLWIWWPKLNRKMFACGLAGIIGVILAVCMCWSFTEKDQIIALDIGQGDAILVSSQGRRVLIDTGCQDTLLLQALARHHVYSLDGVVITHHDLDHYGSLPALRGTVRVGAIYVAQDGLSCMCTNCTAMRDAMKMVPGADYIGLSVGDVMHVGNIDLDVVWPYAFAEEGGNADSVCMLALYDCNRDGLSDITTLLTGDAELDVIEALIQLHVVGDIEIYKVGHHGSKNALTLEQAYVLKPEISLVSVGAHNRYGHPSSDTIDILKSVDSAVYRTDTFGDVSCIMSRAGVTVRTLR